MNTGKCSPFFQISKYAIVYWVEELNNRCVHESVNESINVLRRILRAYTWLYMYLVLSPNSTMPTWLPLYIRDKPVTSPLICPRRRRLPRLLYANGLAADLSRGLLSRWFETPKHPRDTPVTWSMSATIPVTSRRLPRYMYHVEVSGKSA